MPSLSDKLTPFTRLPVPPQFADRLAPFAEALPDRTPIELRTEADFYGASWEIARAIGLGEPPRSVSSWFHGFIHRLASPNQFLWNEENHTLQHHLVSTQKEADFLTAHGRTNVHAVGAPFLYAASAPVPRRPGSLLIAPGLNRHLAITLAEQLDRVLDSIRPLRARLDFVLCCFKPRFLMETHGLTKVLIKHDVPWMEGAEFNDANALRRMRAVYSSFEVVMSDTVGAHLAQASLCGSRVCVFGPPPELDRALLATALDASCQVVREDAKMLDSFVDNPDYYRERLPFLFRSPEDAGAFPEWGGELLGLPHQRPPEEMARLLGWHYCPGSPGFDDAKHAGMAATLGWLPAAARSAHALHESLHQLERMGISLPEAVAELKIRRKEHKSLAKELEQAKSNVMKLTGRSEALTRLRQTFAWRAVGRHVYSVEKFIRRHLPGK
jgi:hypothetical protein